MYFARCVLLTLSLVSLFAQEKTQPSPGRPAEPRSVSDDIKKNSQENKASATQPPSAQPAAVKNSDTAPTRNRQTSDIAPKDQEQTVRISSIPTVTVQSIKDWTDRAFWVFSLVLVIVGVLQVFVLIRQNRIINQSLILTHRPRLIIKRLTVDEPGRGALLAASRDKDPPFKPTEPIHGRLLLVNTGASDATIIGSECRVVSTGEPEAIAREVPPHMAPVTILASANDRITPGEIRECRFEGRGPATGQYAAAIEGKFNLNLYVLGWIEYRDRFGIVRRTSFCRRYLPDLLKFEPIKDDPDYESVD